MQQVATGQRFWWRTLDASTPKPATYDDHAAAEAYAYPQPSQPYAAAAPAASPPARHGAAAPASAKAAPVAPLSLQIPRGERRHRGRTARKSRRWLWAVAGLSSLLAAAVAAVILAPAPLALAEVKANAETLATRALVALGFGLDQISITGQRYTADADIFDALDLGNVRTFAALDAPATLKRIERLPWIDSAQIQRVFPGKLEIAVRERAPSVLWRRGTASYLVDGTGRVLGPAPAHHGWSLPLITGEGGNQEAAVLLTALRRHPSIAGQFARAERVAERRWRIVLKSGTELELAADREVEGLAQLAAHSALLATPQPLAIDVRTPGRIAVRSLTRREALALSASTAATAATTTVSAAAPNEAR